MTNQVYFIEGAKGIKIGVSKNVPSRLRILSKHMAKPPVLLGVIDGGYPAERAIHKRLARHSVGNEWFKDCREVRTLIDGILARGLAAMNVIVEAPKVTPFVPNPPNPKAFGDIARLMWGENATAELCELSGEKPEVVNDWLDATVAPPRIVALAFATLMLQWIWESRSGNNS